MMEPLWPRPLQAALKAKNCMIFLSQTYRYLCGNRRLNTSIHPSIHQQPRVLNPQAREAAREVRNRESAPHGRPAD